MLSPGHTTKVPFCLLSCGATLTVLYSTRAALLWARLSNVYSVSACGTEVI